MGDSEMAGETDDAKPAGEGGGLASRRLLLVDDDEVTLTLLESGLRQGGYDVVAVDSGRKALAVLESMQFDLAILDINMPEMSGLEVASRLRDEHDVPFLFLSGHDHLDQVRTAAEEGALGYLLKPLLAPQLVPAIEAAMVRGREIAQLRDMQSRLGATLAVEQSTRTAVGILMERERIDRRRAFELLRNRARSQRRKLVDVADDIIAASETLSGAGRRKGAGPT